jgi:purine-cytosine permease-like protein
MKINWQRLDRIVDITIVASVIVILTISGIAAMVLHHRDAGWFLLFVVLLLLLALMARNLKARSQRK